MNFSDDYAKKLSSSRTQFIGCHEDVKVIVQAAVRHNVCIIPFGGEFTSAVVLSIVCTYCLCGTVIFVCLLIVLLLFVCL